MMDFHTVAFVLFLISQVPEQRLIIQVCKGWGVFRIYVSPSGLTLFLELSIWLNSLLLGYYIIFFYLSFLLGNKGIILVSTSIKARLNEHKVLKIRSGTELCVRVYYYYYNLSRTVLMLGTCMHLLLFTILFFNPSSFHS